ncbi:MAG: NAD(P)H-hydrate dehydratase [Gammaproteobacteria bacterium]
MKDPDRGLYALDPVRALERRALAAGISGYELMQRAAAAVLAQIAPRWPQARHWLVLCGPGNNGGDGYVIARLARAAGHTVQLVALGEPTSPEARAAARDWYAAGGTHAEFRPGLLDQAELVVDALLGIGLRRPVEGALREVIDAVNAASCPVVAVDLPSGLNASTGAVMGTAVRAELTVSFILHKQGLFTHEAPDHTGERVLDRLGLAPDPGLRATAELLHPDDLPDLLPRRPRTAHKGRHGHVLVIGGDHGMAGAALLAGRAALRAGAGLVSLATRAEHAAALAAAQPELMVHAVADPAALRPLLARATVLVVGPGLGQGGWAQALLAAVQAADRPRVLDADALNALAVDPQPCPGAVLTPHPGEAARLLGSTTQAIQQDRYAAAAALRERYGAVVVLKGAGSLVYGAQQRVCPYGNPGMGTGGMGDVLAGIIGAFMAQGLDAERAAQAGVLAHALAGDLAAGEGERGLLPGDLLARLRAVINP